MRQFVSALLISLFVASAYGSSCTSPKATVTSFSTQDATILTQLAHVGEFSLKCGNGGKPNLFAEFPCGKVVPVAQVGDDKYQVSSTLSIFKNFLFIWHHFIIYRSVGLKKSRRAPAAMLLFVFSTKRDMLTCVKCNVTAAKYPMSSL